MSPFSYFPKPESSSLFGEASSWKGSFCIFALVAALFYNTAALAQDYRGTAEQRAACTPDAFRLCAGYIPDASKVENCLRQRQPDLSEACRSIFQESGGPVADRNR
jgi:hypothetical protein